MGNGSSGKSWAMKTTMEIPDGLYREIEDKSAKEGHSVRSVTLMLYDGWLHGRLPLPLAAPSGRKAGKTARVEALPCFAVGRRFVRRNADGPHDMAAIRKSIAAGRAGADAPRP